MSALGHHYTFGFEDYLFPLNRKSFALIKNIYDRFGGFVHTQAERHTGKKICSKAPYTYLWGTSAIVSKPT